MPQSRRSGPLNSVTDVEGILVGNFSDHALLSGVTVVVAEGGAVGGVDVRGSAPGTRETDLLDPVNLVERVDAVALCGGSAYGLSAAGGVMKFLEEKGMGLQVGEGRVVPIVPAAVIFDLGRGEKFGHITEEDGYRACGSLSAGRVGMGNVGAGMGAVSGGLKGGLGSASEELVNGITVGAIAVVNSTGATFDPGNGTLYVQHLEIGGEFGVAQGKHVPGLPYYKGLVGEPGRHTTIGVVATDASLSKAQATKVAQMAQDGVARAIYPAHTMFDGDTIFCLSTGRRALPEEETRYGRSTHRALSLIGASAADVFARAIVRAVLSAESVGNYKSLRDAYPTLFGQREKS